MKKLLKSIQLLFFSCNYIFGIFAYICNLNKLNSKEQINIYKQKQNEKFRNKLQKNPIRNSK